MSKQLAQEIDQALGEPNVGQVYKVVHVIGADRTRAFLQQTVEIEASGGMMTVSGQRRRTPGGVFFYLVRSSVSAEERKAILLKRQKSNGSVQHNHLQHRRLLGVKVRPISVNS